MATVRVVCLIVIIWLLTACGSTVPPTSVPTNTPQPTLTPIPGYVGGEEDRAYTSFLAYYATEADDCYFDPDHYIEAEVDKEYRGKALYGGDGIWRFYVKIFTRTGYLVDGDFVFDEWTPREEILDVQSQSDRTWANICTSNPQDYSAQEPEYEQDYPDQPEEEPREPPEPDWP